ncbi:MAG: helix-turn-helix domain-containing protein [Fervidicoccaceae archaeon]
MSENGFNPLDLISAEIGSMTKLLHLMGLGKREINIYLYLLTTGPSTAREIAQSLSIPYSKAYDSLSKLERLGWVLRGEGRPRKFYSVSIKEIWEETKRNIETRMLEIEEKLIPLIERVASAQSPLFKIVLIGEEEIHRSFKKMLEWKGKEISIAIAHQELLEEEILELISALWGERARILLTRDVLESLRGQVKLKETKLRVIKEMFGSGIIGGGIMLVFRNGGRLSGLWSDHAYFVDLGRVYFEYLWSQSRDVSK